MKKSKKILIIFGSVIIGVCITISYIILQNKTDTWVSKGSLEKSLSNVITINIIKIDENAEFPHSMELKMYGHIDGIGNLTIGWSDTVDYMTYSISDTFQLVYDADWYNDNCFITYQPINAIKGKLNINYKIYSSRK